MKRSWNGSKKLGLLTLLLITLPMSCRFGNRVENATQADPISGFYETVPSSVEYCTTVSGSTQCLSGLQLAVPDEIAPAMSNPVLLYFYDLTIGLYQFIPVTGTNYAWPVYAQIDGTLQGFEAPTPRQYWRSETCKISKSFEQNGKWTRTQGPWTSGKQDKFPPVGRISIDFQRIISFDGDCTSILKDTLACYNDFNTCAEGSLSANQAKQNEIRGIYNPYIEAGTMTINDIPKVSALGYEVSYR